MNYKEQYLHPNWQKRRLEILQRHDFMCMACMSNTKTLHVHHRCYFPGRMVWDYEDKYLDVFCDDCHEIEEKALKDLEASIIPFLRRLNCNSILIEMLMNAIHAVCEGPAKDRQLPVVSVVSIISVLSRLDKDGYENSLELFKELNTQIRREKGEKII